MKTADEIKIELKDIVKLQHLKSWNNTDNTFKPICNRLRELRYKIVNNN